MISRSDFNKEIAAKVLAKGAGVFKQLAVLFFIGVSANLDTFYVASSFCGIILALVAWSEIVVLPELSSTRASRVRFVFTGFLKNIVLASVFLSVFTVFLGGVVYGEEFLTWLSVLAFWAVLNVINNCYLLLFRVQVRVDFIANYYRISSISGALLFILGAFFMGFISVDEDMLVWLLLITIFAPEVYFSVRYVAMQSSLRLFSRGKFLSFKGFLQRYVIRPRSLSSLIVILLVFGIDAIDKYFSTVASVAPNGASILVYGALLPLTMRVALDAKTLFYSALSQSGGEVKAWGLMWLTHAKVMKIYIPLMMCAAISCWLVGEWLLGLGGVATRDASAIVGVFYIYALLIPLYILWDFIYRVYHINNLSGAIIGLVVAGFVLNVILNYVFVVFWGMGAEGIALSTMLVYLLYCVAGGLGIASRLK